MDNLNGFYTLKGYQMNEPPQLTNAMEDYLEMIYRLLTVSSVVRVNVLAETLHVRPSSASKMIQQLKGAGCVNAEKYGYITLTEKGGEIGRYLIYRHEVIHRFLSTLTGCNNETEQTEKIEHFLNAPTVEKLNRLTLHMAENHLTF